MHISSRPTRARQNEDRHLHSSSKSQHGEAERDGPDAGARAHDRAINEPMRVAVIALVLMFVLMHMLAWPNRL